MIASLLIVFLAVPPDSAKLAAHPPAADSSATAHSLAVTPGSAADSIVLTLPEVRIERERAMGEARRRLPTAFVSEIAAGQSNRALETLSEVLAQAAGVHVDQYGGLGAFSTVSLRGAPPGQVSVYLDGTPLTSATHGVVNLGDLPAGAIDRVEVYRGLSPLAFGPARPGGAINLVTSPVTELRELRLAHGSYDTWEGRASAGAVRGAFSALLHGGLQSSSGDFVYLDDHGTPYNPADDRDHARLNNRFDAATAIGTLRWRPRPGLDLSLREDLFRKTQGLPGLGTTSALNTRLAFARSITQLEIARAGGSPALGASSARGASPVPGASPRSGARRARSGLAPDARLSGSVERERNRFRDDGGSLGLGELRLGRHDSDDHLAGEHAALELGWPRLPAGLALSASADAGVERADLRDPEDGYPDPPPSSRHSRGASLGADWSAPGKRLTLHAARRWDRVTDHLHSSGVAGSVIVAEVTRELDSPQLGARLALPLGVELRSNWARADRAPDFLELFGNRGTVTGNPKLRPETGENHDLGLAWNVRRGLREATLEWAWFESRISDLILYSNNSPSTVRADNISSALVRGEELSVRVRPLAPLAISGSVTWQSALDTGPVAAWRGKRLPQRPGREAYLRADVTHAALRVSADLQYLADDYRDRYNSPRYRVASRTLVGASVSASLRGAARLIVEGKNLGDRRLADVAGYPLPGRSVFVSMEVRLGTADSARQ